MKLYVAGPITGIPDKNRTEFERVRDMLVHVGHDARTPHQFREDVLRERSQIGRAYDFGCDAARIPGEHPDVPETWEQWMWFDLHYLTTWQPDAAVFLMGWEASRGATLEALLFGQMGKRCFLQILGNVFTEPTTGRGWAWHQNIGLVESPHASGQPDKDFGLLVDKTAGIVWPGMDPDALEDQILKAAGKPPPAGG